MEDFDKYLKPSHFIQSDHPMIINFMNENVSMDDSPKDKAIKLYYAVRDQIAYSPDDFSIKKEFYYPVVTLYKKATTCVPKAILLCLPRWVMQM